MSEEYGVTRTFGTKTYGASGYPSLQAALMSVHMHAYENGDWRPRELREKWWQFWRPTEHNEIEKEIISALSEPKP